MREIKLGAERYASGDFSYELDVSRTARSSAGSPRASNLMAAQLDRQIRTVTDQSNEREAMLSSMVEGMLAVDTDERMITVNRAAADLLGVARTRLTAAASRRSCATPSCRASWPIAGRRRAPVEGEMTLRSDGSDASCRSR